MKSQPALRRLISVGVFLGTFVISHSAWAPPGGNGGGGGGGKNGRGENAPGIITVNTDAGPAMGLFSDDTENPTYIGPVLEGDDCVTIITPAEDGVDQGRLVFFAPFASDDCVIPRQISVLGSGEDLNGDEGGDPELIDTRFSCSDVFPNDSPLPGGVTSTSCSLEVRDYGDGGFADGEFERTWIIEWSLVNVTHLSTDVRQLVAASDAEIFQLVAPTKGKGKKDKDSVGFTPIPFDFEITRVRTP